ncbi:MAG TPA: hypothetical protein VF146_17390 [Bryobacteraceae bacterium]
MPSRIEDFMSRLKYIEIGGTHFLDARFLYEKQAWLVIGTILLAALTGILGHRRLSGGNASGSPALVTNYEGLVGNATTPKLELSIGPAGAWQPLRIRFGNDGAGTSAKRTSVPQPVRTEPLAAGMLAGWPSATTPEIRNLTLGQQPSGPATLWYRILIHGGPSIQVRRLVSR